MEIVVSSTYVLDNQERLAGFICESLAYQVYAPAFLLTVIKVISRIVPRLPVLRLKNQDFVRDPTVVASMDADPLIAGEVQPTVTVAALATANDRLKAGFASIRLPVPILHGAHGKVTRPSGSQEFPKMAGSVDKTLKLYDGHSHDLFDDLGRERVLADVVGMDRCPAPGQKRIFGSRLRDYPTGATNQAERNVSAHPHPSRCRDALDANPFCNFLWRRTPRGADNSMPAFGFGPTLAPQTNPQAPPV